MKQIRFLVWLLIGCALLQMYISVQSNAEFKVIPPGEFLEQQKYFEQLSNGSREVASILIQKQFASRQGAFLAYCTLILNAVGIVILCVLLRKLRRNGLPLP